MLLNIMSDSGTSYGLAVGVSGGGGGGVYTNNSCN